MKAPSRTPSCQGFASRSAWTWHRPRCQARARGGVGGLCFPGEPLLLFCIIYICILFVVKVLYCYDFFWRRSRPEQHKSGRSMALTAVLCFWLVVLFFCIVCLFVPLYETLCTTMFFAPYAPNRLLSAKPETPESQRIS